MSENLKLKISSKKFFKNVHFISTEFETIYDY